MLMRSCFLTIILFCATAQANPVAPDPPLNAYISSEKLAVTIGPTEARFNGTFTFKIAGNVSNIERAMNVARLQIPVWFPADARQSSAIASFWKAMDQTSIRICLIPRQKKQSSKLWK